MQILAMKLLPDKNWDYNATMDALGELEVDGKLTKVLSSSKKRFLLRDRSHGRKTAACTPLYRGNHLHSSIWKRSASRKSRYSLRKTRSGFYRPMQAHITGNPFKRKRTDDLSRLREFYSLDESFVKTGQYK